MYFYHHGNFFNDIKVIDCADKSFQLGDGFFTTLLLDVGHVLFLTEHVTRLNDTSKALGYDWQISVKALRIILKKLCILNGGQQQQLRVRVMVSRGVGNPGLYDNKSIATLTVIVSPWKQTHAPKSLIWATHTLSAESLLVQYKTTSRLEYVLAMKQALEQGADDAILCDRQQHVLCSSCANIFVLNADGQWLTPSGGLPGITRGAILKAFAGDICEADISADALLSAKCIVLSNALLGVHLAYFQELPTHATNYFDIFKQRFITYCHQYRENINRLG